MLSYLSNRQYKKMTQCLPSTLNNQQPQIVYLPSYGNSFKKQSLHSNNSNNFSVHSSTKLLKMKKKSKVCIDSGIGDGCPTCFAIDNITVKYYSKKHICIDCRKFLRDQHGNQIKIFVNKQGQITCLGILKLEPDDTRRPDHKVYYHTDFMKLNFNGKSAFATFAAEDQMVVLLRASQ